MTWDLRTEAEESRAPTWYLVLTGLVAFGSLLGVWIALVGSVDIQDNIAGLIVAAVGTATGWVVTLGGRAVPRVRRGDMVELARMMPRLVTGWRRCTPPPGAGSAMPGRRADTAP